MVNYNQVMTVLLGATSEELARIYELVKIVVMADQQGWKEYLAIPTH